MKTIEDKISFVALDLDGTLLDSNKQMPADFKDFVRTNDDILFAIASGRQYYALLRDFSDLKDRLVFVADNGSFVFNNDELIHMDVLSQELGLYLYSMFKDKTIIVCGKESAYMSNRDRDYKYVADMYYGRLAFVEDLEKCFYSDAIGKIAIFFKNKDAKEQFKNLPVLPDGVVAVVSGDEWIDISLSSSSKGDAIKAVLDRFDISSSNAMAFGDYMNDYTMFKAVKYGIAMANACAELKDIAYDETLSNDEDGVMRVLRQLNDH